MQKESVGKFLPRWILHVYWLARVLQIKVIKWIPKYDEDELMTAHNCDFVNEERFGRCYGEAVRAGLAISETIRWRAHVVCWAAQRGASLEGDFVECGVNRGFLSKIVMDYVSFSLLTSKTFYLMDTFDGFAEKYLTEQEAKKIKALDKGGGYTPCYAQVLETFRAIPNAKIVKGAIPDTLTQVASSRIAYLSIDMNCVMPEIAAAEYFWGKLVPGAAVVLDDYGHAGHELQKKAFDDFARRHGVPILSIPTGQAIILKP